MISVSKKSNMIPIPPDMSKETGRLIFKGRPLWPCLRNATFQEAA